MQEEPPPRWFSLFPFFDVLLIVVKDVSIYTKKKGNVLNEYTWYTLLQMRLQVILLLFRSRVRRAGTRTRGIGSRETLPKVCSHVGRMTIYCSVVHLDPLPAGMRCRTGSVQVRIQPRKHLFSNNAEYTAPTRQHELQ